MWCGNYEKPNWEAVGVLELGHTICSKELYAFEKNPTAELSSDRECLTMRHQVTMHQEPIVSQVLLSTPCNKVRWAQQLVLSPCKTKEAT